MFKKLIIMSRYVANEAWQTRFFLVVIALALIALGFGLFVGQIALTEKQAMQSSLVAAFLRLGAVYAISLFVISSMVREFQSKVIYLWLSMPLPRSVYLLSKLFGFALVAAVIAMIFGGTLFFYADPLQVTFWTISLFAELLIVTAVSLLFVISFPYTVPAFSAVTGFYILARSITAIQLMTQGPLFNSQTVVDQMIQGFVNFLAMLLPDLSQLSKSDWVVYQTATWETMLPIIMQSLIYSALLLSAGLFDLYRKNL